MLRETLLTRQFNNAASEAEYELFISRGGRGRRSNREGGEWIVIVPEVRQSSESVTSRGIYMEIPYAFGETCFSPRLVSFSFQETQLHGYIYKGRPFEPITRDLVGFASREITPSRTLRGVLLHFHLSIPLLSSTLCSPFRSQYLFCLDRSTRSLIPHSRYWRS